MDILLNPSLQHFNLYLIILIITVGLFYGVKYKRKNNLYKKVYEISYWLLTFIIIFEVLYLLAIPAYNYIK
ncbi:hypothetical protein SAMN06265218_104101 [Fodinibius sediminis]|uniref:Uncharacterized protein n=1 Tax=Fodinibius sediminis TaxID=1214077 RepID=A0A521BWL4_9BACT|nr:hypothetical protein SAMN06265218_104101 [Fodinibius sediminis]